MKLFTPDLLVRFGSDDNQIASAAQDEWEERAEEYARYLSDIEAKLPKRFRELLDQFYLHDARVIPQSSLMRTDLAEIEEALRPGTHSSWRGFEGQARCALAHSIWLQLDPPPREVLVLQYRSVQIENAIFHKEILLLQVLLQNFHPLKVHLIAPIIYY